MDSENGSGSSKHSRTHQEVVDGSGSSKHSRIHRETVDGSGSSKHSTTSTEEVFYGSGSSKHSRTHCEAVDGSGSSKHSTTNTEEVFCGNGSSKHSTHSEVIDGCGSSRHSAIHPEATVDEGGRSAAAKNLLSFSSASSSSSQTSLEDYFFRVSTNEVTKSRADITASPKPDEDAQPGKKHGEIDDSSYNSSKSEEPDNGSNGLASSSQVSDITHESVLHSMSPVQSPSVQVMERSGDHSHHYRIPSSVFARSKSTTPLEWSVASNESLFSIHVGNNSFSRDHIFMLGGDFSKSGELTKSGDLIMFSPPPPVTIVETEYIKSVEQEENFGAAIVADESIRDCTGAPTNVQNKEPTDVKNEEKIPPPAVLSNSSSISHHSDGSGTSTRSFAFPIKKKCAWPFCYCSNCSCRKKKCAWPFCHCRSICSCRKKKCAWPFCYCSNCSWAFCYCTWPSCYLSNCSRAFCYCWNCSRKRLCCFSSTILTEGVRSRSVKVDAEQQRLQAPTSKMTFYWPTKKWFPCFSCCPHCCC